MEYYNGGSLSIDLGDLIDELRGDIAECETFEDDELVIWAYWTILPDGQELYVDYYFQDEPEDDFNIRFKHDNFLDDFDEKDEVKNVKELKDFVFFFKNFQQLLGWHQLSGEIVVAFSHLLIKVLALKLEESLLQ